MVEAPLGCCIRIGHILAVHVIKHIALLLHGKVNIDFVKDVVVVAVAWLLAISTSTVVLEGQIDRVILAHWLSMAHVRNRRHYERLRAVQLQIKHRLLVALGSHLVGNHRAGLFFGDELVLALCILFNHERICELIILVYLHTVINWNQRLLILQIDIVVLEKLPNILDMTLHSGR